MTSGLSSPGLVSSWGRSSGSSWTSSPVGRASAPSTWPPRPPGRPTSPCTRPRWFRETSSSPTAANRSPTPPGRAGPGSLHHRGGPAVRLLPGTHGRRGPQRGPPRHRTRYRRERRPHRNPRRPLSSAARWARVAQQPRRTGWAVRKPVRVLVSRLAGQVRMVLRSTVRCGPPPSSGCGHGRRRGRLGQEGRSTGR